MCCFVCSPKRQRDIWYTHTHSPLGLPDARTARGASAHWTFRLPATMLFRTITSCSGEQIANKTFFPRAARGRLENGSELLLRTNSNDNDVASWAMSPGQLWYGGHHCPAQLSPLPPVPPNALAQGSDIGLENGRDGDPGATRTMRTLPVRGAPADMGTGGVIPKSDLIFLIWVRARLSSAG
jgi:hypothetical protein